jgi:hypothetical protein
MIRCFGVGCGGVKERVRDVFILLKCKGYNEIWALGIVGLSLA